MIEQNIYFQEEYKRLDNLCKDCYNSKEGVSEYIRQMETYMYEGLKLITGWDAIYKYLKHIRWVRNQLAHEVGTLTSNIVEDEDLSFVSSFYNKILNANDPLSLYRQIKHNQRKQLIEESKSIPSQKACAEQTKKEKSFISKLFSKIKKLF